MTNSEDTYASHGNEGIRDVAPRSLLSYLPARDDRKEVGDACIHQHKHALLSNNTPGFSPRISCQDRLLCLLSLQAKFCLSSRSFSVLVILLFLE